MTDEWSRPVQHGFEETDASMAELAGHFYAACGDDFLAEFPSRLVAADDADQSNPDALAELFWEAELETPAIEATRIAVLYSMQVRRVLRSTLPRDELMQSLFACVPDVWQWVGVWQGVVLGIDSESKLSASLLAVRGSSGSARARANARWAKDPKTLAKKAVFAYWQRWQRDPSLYAGPSEFARDMLEKHAQLESDVVLRRWCAQWLEGRNIPA